MMDFNDFTLDLSSLGQDNQPDPGTLYDLLILGGGPAAMTAAVYAARKMINAALLTQEFGGQVGYTSDIQNFPGFQAISGEELIRRFKEQVEQFEVPVRQGVRVSKVEKEGDLFLVRMEGGGLYKSRTVIVVTGKRHRELNVPGEKELVGRGVAYCATCDAPLFKDKQVVVVGGGNSAFTTAEDLLKVTSGVTIVNFSEGWHADPIMVEAVRKHQGVRLLEYSQVTGIDGPDQVTGVRVKSRATGVEEFIPADGVFIEVGLSPNSDPVAELAELNEMREVVVDCHCRTNVPGLYAAGDVTTVPYKQIIISAGEGAKAALSAYDFLTGRGLS